MRRDSALISPCPGLRRPGDAQLGRSQDWNTFGSDIGRSGAERSDILITKDSVAKEFALLYKTKLDEAGRGQRSVTPPVVDFDFDFLPRLQGTGVYGQHE